MQELGTTPSPHNLLLLLPWHAAGSLRPAQARRIDASLAREPALANAYAAIQSERQATIASNESLGAPSPRALLALFAAIDADRASGRKSS